jgi:hypothetical protein
MSVGGLFKNHNSKQKSEKEIPIPAPQTSTPLRFKGADASGDVALLKNILLGSTRQKPLGSGRLKMSTKMDKEEKEILGSYKKGEWKRVKDFDAEKKKSVLYASETFKKDKRMNIRLSH